MMFSWTCRALHGHLSAVPADGGQTSSPAPAEDRAPGVLEALSAALASARASVTNFLDLVALEAHRAGLALMWIVIWGLCAGICVVAAWLGLMAALAMWAISFGLDPILAVIGVAALNIAAAAVLIFVCIGMSRDLLFSATRRQVAGKSPVKPSAP